MNRSQVQTILWLRWRLTLNQWKRGGGWGAIVAVLITWGVLLLSGGALIGGFLFGLFVLRDASSLRIMGVWLVVTLAFLLFWTVGLLTELQRAEAIDLQRLLHLPVALGQMFTINYVASHLAFSVLISVPVMLGLAFGLSVGRSPVMVLLVPLTLSVVFMVTAWTYCLRGWLATLMANPRRRRSIIMVITVGFILLAQGPNLYFNVVRRIGSEPEKSANTPEEARRQRQERRTKERETFQKLREAQKYVPPFWLPVGAQALAENRPLPALLGSLGCLLIGASGLQRAYGRTIKFYRGESKAKPIPSPTPRSSRKETAPELSPAKATSCHFLERHLPGVPEQAAALALATFRSMLRAPEVKMAWATSFIVTVIIGGSLFMRATPRMPESAKPFVVTGVAAFSIFLLVQFLANQFGFDRDGFRSLVLSPASRKHVLLGKNLACLPVAATFGLFVMAGVCAWLDLSVLAFFTATFQFVTMFTLAVWGGNCLSILVPYRISAGSMKPKKMPATAMIVMVLCQMLLPVIFAPAFLPPLVEMLLRGAGFTSLIPVALILSILLALLALLFYWLTLDWMGRLLQSRETKILQIVSAEVE